jgi:hypothetical protein
MLVMIRTVIGQLVFLRLGRFLLSGLVGHVHTPFLLTCILDVS